jgi:Copper type II ascorbate-dependent monooxygenase, C-terminal domain
MRTFVGALFCSILAVGCGSSVDDVTLAPIVEGETTSSSYTVNFPPVTIAPGTENTQCIVARVGNDEIIRVHQIHNTLPQGSHHLILYRTSDTEEILTPYDCDPFIDSFDPAKGSTVMVTQKHEDTLTLPAGVAFTMPPEQMVRLEMHYINTTSVPIDVSATSTFTTIPAKEYKHEADFLFVGTPDIELPAHSKTTIGPTYFGIPDDLANVNFFGITGHTHQWGRNVTVNAAESKDGPEKSVYDVPGWLWSEPATVMHDPVFTVPQGGGFRFTCEYNNLGDQKVGFGESANDEMCFFWAYYYPSQGAYVCVHTKQIGGGYDLCCPGNSLCSFFDL